MSGPWPQIIICTNFSSLSSPTAPALIRAYFRHRQPTLLHLWLSFSQTREILRRGAKTRDNASCERVNRAGAPRGEGGCSVRSNVVRSMRGRGVRSGETHDAQTRGGGEPGDQCEGWTPDPQLIRRCSTPSWKTINNPGSWSDILFIYFVKCSSSSSKSWGALSWVVKLKQFPQNIYPEPTCCLPGKCLSWCWWAAGWACRYAETRGGQH